MKNKLFKLEYENVDENFLNDNFWHYQNNYTNYINHWGIIMKYKSRLINLVVFGICLEINNNGK